MTRTTTWTLSCGALCLISAIACCATSPPAGGGANPTAQPGNAAVVAAPAASGAATPPKTAKTTAKTSAKTEQECRACRGVWDVHGIATEKFCVCRTSDGGKRCRDAGECEGMCIATDEPEREEVQKGPPSKGYFVGRCSDLVTVFGCNRLIDRGAAARGPVPLAEPPPSMCVD